MTSLDVRVLARPIAPTTASAPAPAAAAASQGRRSRAIDAAARSRVHGRNAPRRRVSDSYLTTGNANTDPTTAIANATLGLRNSAIDATPQSAPKPYGPNCAIAGSTPIPLRSTETAG